MWDEMFISKNEKGKEEEGEKEERKEENIISREAPPEYTGDNKKSLKLYREFKKEEYEEIFEFNKTHNKLSSGNVTFLTPTQLTKFSTLGMYSVLARGGAKDAIIGTILSLPLPISCSSKEESRKETFGVTSYLTVHEKLRDKNIAMALIRELAITGHENGIYCSYFTSSKKIGENSIELTSWFRPLNLPKTIGLGFLYPNWNHIPSFKENMAKYSCKAVKNYKTVRLTENSEKCVAAFNFYIENIEGKKFAFSPDISLFKKWVKAFPTFSVVCSGNIVGVFSYMGVQSKMATGLEGLLCLPLFFVCKDEKHRDNCMKTLIHTAHEEQFDVLYGYVVGEFAFSGLLETTKCITQPQSSIPTYFSVYNHSISLTPEDLYVPIF